MIAASTVWLLLIRAGIDPAPRRVGLTWRQLLSPQRNRPACRDARYCDCLPGRVAW